MVYPGIGKIGVGNSGLNGVLTAVMISSLEA